MLKGFGVTGYRSFGPSLQCFYPLEKINIIAGRNNSGKSNVLRLVAQLRAATETATTAFSSTSLDKHMGSRSAEFSIQFPIEIDKDSVVNIAKTIIPSSHNHEIYVELIENILKAFPNASSDVAWSPVKISNGRVSSAPDLQGVISRISPEYVPLNHDIKIAFQSLWSVVTKQSGGGFERDHGPQVLAAISQLAIPSIPTVQTIGAHRQIGDSGTTYEGLDGKGLIQKLLALQSPELSTRKDDLAKFDKINSFLATVLESDGARLEIPFSGRELNVNMDGKVLPIQSLGTGVHEVLIFAAAATMVENSILCIEEPEIHLHPRLQRQLLNYLAAQTNNQYFITTHSATLLDTKSAAIFHVTLNQHGESEVCRINMNVHRANLGFDLGYKASDLVQANMIIWVEGPSDRIYLNAWIKALDEDLQEGLHYSVMFYGGRLLSHLAIDDDSVKDFIQLQRINRNVAILIDSDRRQATDLVNETKQRVLEEIERAGGLGWVTAGREMENYISGAAVEAALGRAHPLVNDFSSRRGQFDCCYKRTGGGAVDKIALARESVAEVNLDVLDLRSKAEALVTYIRRVNK